MTPPPPERVDGKASQFGIRFQMFVALNSLMAVLVTGFLIFEYHVNRSERLAAIRTSLDEEARLLWLGFHQLQPADPDSAQAFVNAALNEFGKTHASEHIVLVSDGASLYRAATAGIPESLRDGLSPDNPALDPVAFVVGRMREDGVEAVIAEDLVAIEAGLRTDLSRHILSVIVLAVAGAAVINMVVSRVVIAPQEQLVTVVEAIEGGALGAQVPPQNSRESSALADTINQMSRTLARNADERARQMAKARRIQERLHPDHVAIPGLQIAAIFRPAEEVGGDFFDILTLSDGRCLVCVADVSGHGVSAALNSVMLKVLLASAVDHSSAPVDVLRSIDAALFELTLPEMFATMVVLRIAPSDGTIEYASAGHETVWLLEPDGEIREISSTGPPVGTGLTIDWDSKVFTVAPGARILLATDGVTEAVAPDGSLFSRTRLGRDFREFASLPLDGVLESIQQDVDRHCQLRRLHDDFTLLGVEFAPNEPAEL